MQRQPSGLEGSRHSRQALADNRFARGNHDIVIDVLRVRGKGEGRRRRSVCEPGGSRGSSLLGRPLVDSLAPPQGPGPAHGQGTHPRGHP
eukprot:5859803-Pyramimonas_sp.AAC.1